MNDPADVASTGASLRREALRHPQPQPAPGRDLRGAIEGQEAGGLYCTKNKMKRFSDGKQAEDPNGERSDTDIQPGAPAGQSNQKRT